MKICPNCKKIDEVIVKSYPVNRVEGFRVSGKDSPKVKQIVDVHHIEISPSLGGVLRSTTDTQKAWMGT